MGWDSVSTNLLLEVRGEEGEGNFAGAVGERQRVAGEDLQLVNHVVRQARLLRRETRICCLAPDFCLRSNNDESHTNRQQIPQPHGGGGGPAHVVHRPQQ